jgi:AraC-like DNA-binding protein
MLWRKVTRAMFAVGREGTIAAAAHAADFADAAHLTRTFYQMFGIPPSLLMRGEFFEIDPPFELVRRAVAPADPSTEMPFEWIEPLRLIQQRAHTETEAATA